MKSIVPLVLAGFLFTGCAGPEAPGPAAEGEAVANATVEEQQPARVEAPPADSASSSLDPCSLVRPEELKQLTGQEFASGTENTRLSNIVGCSFVTPGSDASISISIYIQHADDTFAQYSAMPGMQPVAGMDQAYSSDMLDSFVARKGERVLVVDWRNLENVGSWMPQLARGILEKL